MKKISNEDLAKLQGGDATVVVKPAKQQAKPEPIAKPQDKPVTLAANDTQQVLKASLASAEKITAALKLSSEQNETLIKILLEIEKERSKPKRAIINRETKGDRLISSVDFITID